MKKSKVSLFGAISIAMVFSLSCAGESGSNGGNENETEISSSSGGGGYVSSSGISSSSSSSGNPSQTGSCALSPSVCTNNVSQSSCPSTGTFTPGGWCPYSIGSCTVYSTCYDGVHPSVCQNVGGTYTQTTCANENISLAYKFCEVVGQCFLIFPNGNCFYASENACKASGVGGGNGTVRDIAWCKANVPESSFFGCSHFN